MKSHKETVQVNETMQIVVFECGLPGCEVTRKSDGTWKISEDDARRSMAAHEIEHLYKGERTELAGTIFYKIQEEWLLDAWNLYKREKSKWEGPGWYTIIFHNRDTEDQCEDMVYIEQLRQTWENQVQALLDRLKALKQLPK
jgi:hypothetical protein